MFGVDRVFVKYVCEGVGVGEMPGKVVNGIYKRDTISSVI